ncbi:hypothetical protein SSX86_031538 [Deinandra increscens subsp. villosa]|uniref:Aldehyde dehydrogenase domain-containing protein n=1 Tax=Deinandra increscens subsp. villosa TaxID=3103831 RepID=A0AAP0C9E3_9ASTR
MKAGILIRFMKINCRGFLPFCWPSDSIGAYALQTLISSEVVEHTCGMTSLQIGEFVSNIRSGVDSYSMREPLGVCAGIFPSNFPALVPLLMFPIAVACGNTFILKPSEKDPGACMILAELAMEAGLPNGVLNIVHGTNDIVNAICDDDDIKAITFVGPDSVEIMMALEEEFRVTKALISIFQVIKIGCRCGPEIRRQEMCRRREGSYTKELVVAAAVELRNFFTDRYGFDISIDDM